VLLALGLLAASCGGPTAPAVGDVAVGVDTPDDSPSEADAWTTVPPPRLRAEGTRLVDATGAEVRLAGANLGGWLFHESWITQATFTVRARVHEVGVRSGSAEAVEAALVAAGRDEGAPGWYEAVRAALAAQIGEAPAAAVVAEAQSYPSLQDDSDLLLRRELTRRFGTTGRDELSDVFQRAWLREADVAWLAGQGFNVVRVPMSYRDLTTDPDDDVPTRLTWNELAFARLDDLLGWCERHGVYAVLDLQESPGGHNGYSGEAKLYGDPALQQLTIELWEELSRRYQARDVVAAYSLLAEPFGAPNAGARDAMYDRLVKAIRARGDDHLLVLHDGFFGMNTLPVPADRGWTGVVYSTHIFEFDATSLEDYQQIVNGFHDPVLTKAQARQGVPYYIGSFSTRKDEPWAYQAAHLLIDWYARHGWSWSVWTLKEIDDPLDWKLWGVRSAYGVLGRLASPFERPDVQRDDFETVRARFAAYADLVVAPNQELLQILKSGLKPVTDWHLTALTSCGAGSDPCEAPAAVAAAGGAVTKVEILGTDVTTFALPAGADAPTPTAVQALTGPDGWQWAHVWPLEPVAGEPLFVTFHVGTALLAGRDVTLGGVALSADVPYRLYVLAGALAATRLATAAATRGR